MDAASIAPAFDRLICIAIGAAKRSRPPIRSRVRYGAGGRGRACSPPWPALQLTNILSDLDEDAGMGRLYLPRECLHAAGTQ